MFVYRARGICPAEIHFQLAGKRIAGLSFVGGGCRGNARLICQLLEGQDPENIIPLLKGIECRSGTSCPDQLGLALEMALRGDLREADPVRLFEDPAPRRQVAVIAHLNGSAAALRAVLGQRTGAVYCLGSITGPGGENDAVVDMVRKEKVAFTRGPLDGPDSCRKPENKDCLTTAPHYLSFRLGERRGLGFYGGYIQEISGFSDFSPYSLELLMVSNLSDYLRNEEVYPALQAMTGQFAADLVLFAHTGLFRHVRLGGVDFVNVGPVEDEGGYKYVLLEIDQDRLKVSYETAGKIQPEGRG